jgi:hypothetical protein
VFQVSRIRASPEGFVNLPICYKCKEEGHMTAECNEFHSKGGEL